MKTKEEIAKIKKTANQLKNKGFGAVVISEKLKEKYKDEFFHIDKNVFLKDNKRVMFIKESN